MSEENFLNKLKASIEEAFPEATDHDATIMSGFVALYCTALPDVKAFLKIMIKEGLAEARKINAESIKEIKEKIDELNGNKKDILN